ncbi:MAG: O-antigen ligase family protein [Candidatus Thiodiazotropha sp.]
MEKLYKLQISEIIRTFKTEGLGFLMICLYLFFEYVRPQSIYPAIDILPWSQLTIIFSILAIGFNLNNIKIPGNPVNKLLNIYALIVILSSIFSLNQEASLNSLGSFFSWFLIYYLIIILVNNKKRFFLFLFIFLLFSFKMSQHGALSWALRGFQFRSWGVTGAPGWFHNSGEVGIQMCIFVPLAVAFIFSIHKHLSKLWFYILTLMPITGIGTIIASSSRGALLGLALACLRPLLTSKKLFIYTIIFYIISSIVVIELIPEESKERFQASGEDRTSLHRLERWEDGIEAMNRYPFLGVGFNAWPEYYDSFIYDLEDQGTLLVHNIFVQCGSELGYSGLIVFIFMIIGCFHLTSKIRKYNGDDRFNRFMSYGFDAALLGFLASGFFVTVLYYPYFWIHAALTVSFYNTARQTVKSETQKEKEIVNKRARYFQ